MNKEHPANSLIRNLGGEVTQERLADEPIFIYTAHVYTRQAVDGWVTGVIETLNTWQEPRLGLIHDFSSGNPFVSPYARQKSQLLATTRPDIRRFAAIILANTISAQLFRIAAQASQRNNVTTQVFFSRQSALKWVRTRLAHHRNDSRS